MTAHGGTYVVMFHKLASSTHGETKRAKHALALTEVGFPILFILDINIESLTFKEDLQITIVLKNWVTSDFIQHAFQSSPPRFDKVGIKPTHSLLLWRRSNNHSGVVVVHGVVKPKKIAVSATDSKLGLAVCFG